MSTPTSRCSPPHLGKKLYLSKNIFQAEISITSCQEVPALVIKPLPMSLVTNNLSTGQCKLPTSLWHDTNHGCNTFHYHVYFIYCTPETRFNQESFSFYSCCNGEVYSVFRFVTINLAPNQIWLWNVFNHSATSKTISPWTDYLFSIIFSLHQAYQGWCSLHNFPPIWHGCNYNPQQLDKMCFLCFHIG